MSRPKAVTCKGEVGEWRLVLWGYGVKCVAERGVTGVAVGKIREIGKGVAQVYGVAQGDKGRAFASAKNKEVGVLYVTVYVTGIYHCARRFSLSPSTASSG